MFNSDIKFSIIFGKTYNKLFKKMLQAGIKDLDKT